MRIQKLLLTSFRSYSDTTIDTNAPRVLIAGENGAGKSTLREAVRWLLTGHCGVTDARGAGADLLAPEHTSLIQVGAVIPELGLVQRRRNNGISEFVVGETKGEPSIQQMALYAKLNTTPEFVDAVLETEHFLRLHHADAKGLVLSLLNVKVPIGDEALTLDELEARLKTATAERRDAKARLRVHTVTPAPAEALPPVADIQAQIDKLREQLAGHEREVGALIGRREELQRRMDALVPLEVVGDVADMRARIESMAAEQVAIPAFMAAQTEPAPADVFNFIERAELLNKRKVVLEAFQPSGGCVLDPEFECPQTRRKVMNRVRAIDVELASLPSAPPPPAEDPFVAQKAVLAQIEHDLPILRERLAKAEAAKDENDRRAVEAYRLREEILAIAEPPAQTVTAMETLRTRIRAGELVLSRAQSYWEGMARREAQAKEHAVLEAEVDRLETLVDLLGPNGARVQALQQAIGQFETAINASTTLFGWSVSFVLEPWGVVVNNRRLETYSESEQFRIGIAVQLAIAQVSGLSFAIIDRLDMLDVKNRTLATKMILAAPVGQVFIMSTREPEAKLPSGSGFIAHRLLKQGGRTVVAESVGV